MEEEVSFCGEAFGNLLYCETSFNALKYWIILQYGLLPTNEKNIL